MGLFDILKAAAKTAAGNNLPRKNDPEGLHGFVPYGEQKKDGSHDHRYNKGKDRTPAQKAGDAARRESDS